MIHHKRSVVVLPLLLLLLLLVVLASSKHSTNVKAKGCDRLDGPKTKGCAVARCRAPPAGCSLVTEYKRGGSSIADATTCCPILCLSRYDTNGKICKFNDDQEEEEEIKCDKYYGPQTKGCRITKCVGPAPMGCSFVTEYKRGGSSNCCNADPATCCPVPCLKRNDANGEICKFEEEDEETTCYKNKKCKFKPCNKNCIKRVCKRRIQGCFDDANQLTGKDKKRAARKNCRKQRKTCVEERLKCPRKLPPVDSSCTATTKEGEQQEYQCIGSPGRCCELDLYGGDIRCWMACNNEGVWQEQCALD